MPQDCAAPLPAANPQVLHTAPHVQIPEYIRAEPVPASSGKYRHIHCRANTHTTHTASRPLSGICHCQVPRQYDCSHGIRCPVQDKFQVSVHTAPEYGNVLQFLPSDKQTCRAGNAVSGSLQKCPALLLPQASPQILLLFLLRRLLRTEGDSEYRSWFSLPLLFYTLLYYIDHFLAIFEPFFPLLTQLFVFLGFPQLISRQT